METSFLLILTSFVALTGVYETTTEASFPTLDECVAAGMQLVSKRADELSATGAEGAVWFRCAEVLGRAIGGG